MTELKHAREVAMNAIFEAINTDGVYEKCRNEVDRAMHYLNLGDIYRQLFEPTFVNHWALRSYINAKALADEARFKAIALDSDGDDGGYWGEGDHY